MDPTDLKLAEIGLDVAGRYGFALAGGYAVQAHGILERPSEDVDLFTAWDRRADFASAVEAVVGAYRAAGYTVAVIQQFETLPGSRRRTLPRRTGRTRSNWPRIGAPCLPY